MIELRLYWLKTILLPEWVGVILIRELLLKGDKSAIHGFKNYIRNRFALVSHSLQRNDRNKLYPLRCRNKYDLYLVSLCVGISLASELLFTIPEDGGWGNTKDSIKLSACGWQRCVALSWMGLEVGRVSRMDARGVEQYAQTMRARNAEYAGIHSERSNDTLSKRHGEGWILGMMGWPSMAWRQE